MIQWFKEEFRILSANQKPWWPYWMK